MLGSQLCVIKGSNKTQYRYVVRIDDFVVFGASRFRCDALSQFNDDACKEKVSPLNSRYHRVQKVLLLMNLPQNTRSGVKC